MSTIAELHQQAYKRGKQCFSQGKLTEAREYFIKAVNIFPEGLGAWYGLAQCYELDTSLPPERFDWACTIYEVLARFEHEGGKKGLLRLQRKEGS